MTKFPFKLNGVDFSRLVHKYGYETKPRPVIASRATDLDGRTKTVVSRWDYDLILPLNDMPADDAAQLGQMLLQSPLDVTYYIHQLQREVTERMMIEDFPLAQKLSTTRTDWMAGIVLEFRKE